MNEELTNFNNKVIEVMKQQNEGDGIIVLDISDDDIALIEMDINNVPSLVFVSLNEDTKSPLIERVNGILLVLRIDSIKSYKKVANWMSLILNKLQAEEILSKPLAELV